MSEVLLINFCLFLPLIGGLLTFLVKNHNIAITGICLAFLASLMLFFISPHWAASVEWLPGFLVYFLLDRTALLLIVLVLFISMLVHVFSIAYMQEYTGKHRYFAKLGFFTFSMIGLLLADHLILLFVFWELVGLASYLLIGFWYGKEGVPSSARQAFMVNRIADVALLAAILMVNTQSGLQISQMNATWLLFPSLLVGIGAFGKSAQLPFSGWLIKAMAGPTPVSALIHAATMVAAGVYLLFRLAPVLHAQALIIIALTGAFTAFYGGVCALFQHDLKKVLAYSTISQLGYMIMGIGVGGVEASMFHLTTHAFFKAGLFLCAGAVIHFLHEAGVSDAQDMRFMGNVRKNLPWTFRAFLVCALALAGLPFFSGFMSKEGILMAAWEWANEQGTWAYLVPDLALLTAFLTALYVGRMTLLVFFGESRSRLDSLFNEPLTIRMPLLLLSLFSVWIWFSPNPLAHESWLAAFFNTDGLQMTSSYPVIMWLSILLTVSGLFFSFSLFKKGTPYATHYGKEMRAFPLLENGFFVNKGYEKIGTSLLKVSRITNWVDTKVMDGCLHLLGVGMVVLSKIVALVDRFVVDGPVNAIAYVSAFLGKILARLSSKYIQTQLVWLIVAIILILIWLFSS